jgi:hypothetical protein
MLRLLSMAFRDGGWAMWAIFGFGLAATGVAVRYAWRGEPLLLRATRSLTAALIASGCAGFFVDLQAVLQYSTVGLDAIRIANEAATADRRTYAVLEGLNESLYCLSSAFLFTVLIASLVAIGHIHPRSAQAHAGLLSPHHPA